MSNGQSLEIMEQGAVKVVEIGLAGAPGTKGPPGTSWLDGHGAPLPGLGLERDHYLDHDTGEVWAKGEAGWALVGNLTGPRGLKGEQGDKGETGDITPELQAARDEAVAAAASADGDATSAGQSAAAAAQSMDVAQQAGQEAVGAAASATQSAGAAAADHAGAADSAAAAGGAASAAAGAAAAAAGSAQLASQARDAAEDARDRAEAAAQGLAFDGDYNSLRNRPDLSLKADKTYVDQQLSGKADAQATSDALALKASKTYVDTGLGGKADAQATSDALALKASKTYVDTGLGNKLDKAANLSDVASATTARANLSLYSKAENDAQIPVGRVRGLVGGSTGLTSVTATFQDVWMRDASGGMVLVTGASRSVSFTTAGAGGRDTASNFNGQWTYVHAIWRIPLASPDLIASASLSAPTLPSGYTHWAFLWPVRVGATNNNIVAHQVRSNRVTYPGGTANMWNGVNVGASLVAPATNISVWVPQSIALTQNVSLTQTGTQTTNGVALTTGGLRDDLTGNQYGNFYSASQGVASGIWGAHFKAEIPSFLGNISVVFDSSCVWASSNLYGQINDFTFIH